MDAQRCCRLSPSVSVKIEKRGTLLPLQPEMVEQARTNAQAYSLAVQPVRRVEVAQGARDGPTAAHAGRRGSQRKGMRMPARKQETTARLAHKSSRSHRQHTCRTDVEQQDDDRCERPTRHASHVHETSVQRHRPSTRDHAVRLPSAAHRGTSSPTLSLGGATRAT